MAGSTIPRKHSRLDPLKRDRSAGLPLGAHQLCFKEPSRSSALRFIGRADLTLISIQSHPPLAPVQCSGVGRAIAASIA